MAKRKDVPNWDVRCVMYERMSHLDKGTQFVVYFNDGLEELIDAERVIPVIDGNRLMFKPVDKKVHGSYALSRGRIQVTAGAKLYKAWDGMYTTLHHDDITNWYYINCTEAVEDPIRYHRKASPHATHRGCTPEPFVDDEAANIQVEDEQLCSPTPGYEPVEAGKIDCRLPKQYRREVLMNLLLDFVEDGAIEPAQKVAKLIRLL